MNDWCCLMLIGADWCWLMTIDTDWFCLMLIDADYNEWCWLMLIDADTDWCRLMLVDASWCSNKVNQVLFCPLVIFTQADIYATGALKWFLRGAMEGYGRSMIMGGPTSNVYMSSTEYICNPLFFDICWLSAVFWQKLDAMQCNAMPVQPTISLLQKYCRPFFSPQLSHWITSHLSAVVCSGAFKYYCRWPLP